MTSNVENNKVLLFGSTGYIGSYLTPYLVEEGYDVINAKSRLDDFGSIKMELDQYNPNFVINAAGLTGRPNVDWCEDHKEDVLRVNTIGASVLADICFRDNIHLTYFGTGCIYSYDEDYPEDSNIGFTEDSEPNFDGSHYSKTKILTEKILKLYNNVLILRIRMPISNDLNPRSFITKISKYEKVVNIPNSMTILSDLLPLVPKLMKKGKTGVLNFTNPGTLSHNQILDLYQAIVDPDFSYTNFTLDEQSLILKAPRSNNYLDTKKLESIFAEDDIQIPSAENSIVSVLEKIRDTLN